MAGTLLSRNAFVIYLLDLTTPKPGFGYLGTIIIALPFRLKKSGLRAQKQRREIRQTITSRRLSISTTPGFHWTLTHSFPAFLL